ncbi:hypothetical protein J6590_096496 [Homalodisca vitripennis]|nr:hypothetical protein J6590_096496 [Homalodisca vitripennis]
MVFTSPVLMKKTAYITFFTNCFLIMARFKHPYPTLSSNQNVIKWYTHAGVKPHHCTFCEQSFLRLSHLQRHIRVHTGERPYSCGQCPKQFARSDKLRQHYIIQHNDNRVKVSKRGRPRKNLDLYTPSTSTAVMPPLNSLYPISINPISMNAV